MSLPSGYKRLEYIKSSGTQYIDTGFKPNQDTRLEMICSPLSIVDANDGSGFIPYGAGESYTSRAFECYTANSQYEFNYDGQYGFIGSPSTGQKLLISHNKNEIKLIIDGSTTLTKSFNYQSFTAPYTMTLFAIHRSSVIRGLMKLYACQIYDNGTLIRDYIPCQTTSGEVGLWDDVNSVFYQNAGSGIFNAGELSKAQKVIINGIGYSATKVTMLIDGTERKAKKGRVLIDGTAYDVLFSEETVTITVHNGAEYRNCYVLYNGQRITSGEINVKIGETIVVYVGAIKQNQGYIYLNSVEVAKGINVKYSYIVTKNATISYSWINAFASECYIVEE